MQFKSVNEIESFRFDDCVILEFKQRNDQLVLLLDALIITGSNSQNTRFTDSYADIVEARFTNCRIRSAVKDGFRYYNADGVLQKEVPDQPLDEKALSELIPKLEGTYLIALEKVSDSDSENSYYLCAEFEGEYNTVGESYTLIITFDDAVFEWDRYKSKVQTS